MNIRIKHIKIIIKMNEEFNPKKLTNKLIEKFNFQTDNSKDIPLKLITYTEAHINRANAVMKLVNYCKNIHYAIGIENGIFEFTLVSIILNKLEHSNVLAIYDDKLNDIILNLDCDSYLKNKTLLNAIKNNLIKPNLVAFMSPQQLHPEKWDTLIKKKEFTENALFNMASTDLYTCRRCGGKKSKVTELQTRSGDEPQTIFITCLFCGTTFRK
jgi:DNA-directed RNA polymerase subunit M/transcription elongation factor TFIIS